MDAFLMIKVCFNEFLEDCGDWNRFDWLFNLILLVFWWFCVEIGNELIWSGNDDLYVMILWVIWEIMWIINVWGMRYGGWVEWSFNDKKWMNEIKLICY